MLFLLNTLTQALLEYEHPAPSTSYHRHKYDPGEFDGFEKCKRSLFDHICVLNVWIANIYNQHSNIHDMCVYMYVSVRMKRILSP